MFHCSMCYIGKVFISRIQAFAAKLEIIDTAAVKTGITEQKKPNRFFVYGPKRPLALGRYTETIK